MFELSRRNASLLVSVMMFSCGADRRSPDRVTSSPPGSQTPEATNGSDDAGTPDSGTADAGSEDGADAEARVAALFPPTLYADALGQGDVSTWLFAGFSQVGTNGSDEQVLELVPDVLPRAWGQWDTEGTQSSDYNFDYTKSCQDKGIAFIGGLTASVIFEDQMSAEEFADEVGRDAENHPVPHEEILPGAYRGSIASPGYRKRLIEIAKLQIDGGVDGLFFDEVGSSYIGANFTGNEGFDDYHVADFGRYLCANYGSDASVLSSFELVSEDTLNCDGSDPGSNFDYRGYLARHGASTEPLGSLNPLADVWGTTLPNRPEPSEGSFVQTAAPLIYWQDVVRQVRAYARETYNKEILITANGIYPFVDFQSIGLYDWNSDSTAPRGFNYVPVVNGHYDGSVSFLSVLSTLKASSKRIVEAAGGHEVPILLFIDWPTDTINRYYDLPDSERQDYVRVFSAEAYALGMLLAMPLATVTDDNTATKLGMLDFFKGLRAYHKAHSALYQNAHNDDIEVNVSAPNVVAQLNTLADGQAALHLINHNYDMGFIEQKELSVSFKLPKKPSLVTLSSPDYSEDVEVPFEYEAGTLSLTIDSLEASVVVGLE